MSFHFVFSFSSSPKENDSQEMRVFSHDIILLFYKNACSNIQHCFVSQNLMSVDCTSHTAFFFQNFKISSMLIYISSFCFNCHIIYNNA